MNSKIIISGATGFIGRPLCGKLLTSGYELVVITRNARKAQQVLGSQVTALEWSALHIPASLDQLEDALAIINLAGENIGAGRWTKKKKQHLVASRVQAGEAMVSLVAQLKSKPRVFLQASGIGIYGDRGAEVLDESALPGTGFMADLAQQWEGSVKKITTLGCRLIYLRTGVVLGPCGGFLSRAVLPFRLFMGGHWGHGQQWISWIHLTDEVRAIEFLLAQENLSGEFNLSAPNPLTAHDFVKTIGKVLRRPSWLHVPAFALKMILGEMAESLILSGQRALPKRLLAAGFEFQFPAVEAALRDILNR